MTPRHDELRWSRQPLAARLYVAAVCAAGASAFVYLFPRTFPRPQMKAVLIQRKDGPYEWTPVERITRIYVVNK